MRKLFLTFTYFAAFLFFLLFLTPFFLYPLGELFREFFTQEVVYSLKLSFITAAVATLITLVWALGVGYSLARYSFPLKGLVAVLIDLPMFFPELLTGFLLLLLFSFPLKWAKELFVFTPYGVVLAQVFVSFPFAVKVLYSTFLQIDPRYELVARSLGYRPGEVFLKVTLPMAKAGLLSALVVAFARSFGAFGAVLVLAGGVYMKTETLPIGIFLNISYGNLKRAVAMGLLLILFSLLTLLLFEIFKPKEKEDLKN